MMPDKRFQLVQRSSFPKTKLSTVFCADEQVPWGCLCSFLSLALSVLHRERLDSKKESSVKALLEKYHHGLIFGFGGPLFITKGSVVFH